MRKITFYSIWIIYIFLFFGCKESKNPAIIEITDMDNSINSADILMFAENNHLDKNLIYQWENHWLIYNTDGKLTEISNKLEKEFKHGIIRTFDKPFYNFNREKLTGEKPAKEWEHIIMTANLVNDTTLQNEYMEYHRTQYEKWPEISKGFINADFQQLLVFRNGRQLMLVISIPKGKTLDELNPKTTENNPRVDEWNKIMAKYQEGIEDAPKGSTWVLFKTIIK